MLVKKLNDGHEDHYAFWCPGCEDVHVLDARWSFNGDYLYPEFRPSYYYNTETATCHLYVTAGRLQYLHDTTHSLCEQSVPMAPLPRWFTGEPELVKEAEPEPDPIPEDAPDEEITDETISESPKSRKIYPIKRNLHKKLSQNRANGASGGLRRCKNG